MRLFRMLLVALGLVGGAMAFGATPSSATPLGASALAAPSGDLVAGVAYRRYHRGYRPVRRVYRPVHYRRGYYRRPVYYRPVTYRRVYRGPRVVCRVRYRTVATPYGWVRRPVRSCVRRW